jgi:Na+/melibiose symporter-like transporter
VGYNGALDPDTQSQSALTTAGIFFMVTLVSGLGYLLAMIPFFFYKLDKKELEFIVAENLKRRQSKEAAPPQQQ